MANKYTYPDLRKFATRDARDVVAGQGTDIITYADAAEDGHPGPRDAWIREQSVQFAYHNPDAAAQAEMYADILWAECACLVFDV